MKTNLICVYVNTKSQRLRFIATNSIENARGTEQSLKALLRAGWFYHQLEKKYGYGGSISPFFYDEEEETFMSAFKKFLDSDDRGTFTVVEITEDTEGIITNKFVSGAPSVTGFYNGEEE